MFCPSRLYRGADRAAKLQSGSPPGRLICSTRRVFATLLCPSLSFKRFSVSELLIPDVDHARSGV